LYSTENQQRKEFPEAPGKYIEVHFSGGSREKPEVPGSEQKLVEIGRVCFAGLFTPL
jgi:hypothetical protein